MKKLLFILSFAIILTSCAKQFKKGKIYKLTTLTQLSNNTVVTNVKEFVSENDEDAYYDALMDILPGFNYNENGKFTQKENKVLSFTILDDENNNILEKLSKKTKDSILNRSMELDEMMLNDLNIQKVVTKENIESLLSDWDGSLPSLVEYTKQNLHNSDSFEHIETGYIDKGEYILIKMIYSAENGFGAIRKASISAKVDYNGKIIEILN